MKKENKALQAKNQLQKVKNREQRTILFVVLGVSLLIIILAIILYCSIQKQKRLNKQLTESREKLREQSKQLEDELATKDKFFSIIAHDLRNPFMGILSFSQMLQEKALEYKIRIRNYMNSAPMFMIRGKTCMTCWKISCIGPKRNRKT